MSKEHQVKPLKLFQCPLSDEFLAEKKGDSVIYHENYETVMFKISNNGFMEVAIHKKYKPTLSTEQVKNIFERIKHTWREEIVHGSFIKKKEKERVLKNINTLAVVAYT